MKKFLAMVLAVVLVCSVSSAFAVTGENGEQVGLQTKDGAVSGVKVYGTTTDTTALYGAQTGESAKAAVATMEKGLNALVKQGSIKAFEIKGYKSMDALMEAFNSGAIKADQMIQTNLGLPPGTIKQLQITNKDGSKTAYDLLFALYNGSWFYAGEQLGKVAK